jgi:hypothetical protein
VGVSVGVDEGVSGRLGRDTITIENDMRRVDTSSTNTVDQVTVSRLVALGVRFWSKNPPSTQWQSEEINDMLGTLLAWSLPLGVCAESRTAKVYLAAGHMIQPGGHLC